LKTKTDFLEEQNMKKSIPISSEPRLSVSSIRDSLGSSRIKNNITSKYITKDADPGAKKFKKFKEKIKRIEERMKELQKFEKRIIFIEEKFAYFEERMENDIAELNERQNHSCKSIQKLEIDLAASLEKNSKDLAEIFNSLQEIKLIQEAREEKNSSDIKQLAKLQKILEAKLENHLFRMEVFAKKIDSLQSQSIYNTETSDYLREQLQLLLQKSSKIANTIADPLRTHQPKTDKPKSESLEPKEPEKEGKDTKKRKHKSHNTSFSKNERNQNKYSTNEELYKQYQHLKRAYRRVFGKSKGH
jgi:chromosome segregation ATPase